MSARQVAVPRRVLHVINGEHYSGAERVQDLLALQLKKLGFEVGFLCLKLGRFDDLRQAKDAPLYDVRMRNRFDLRAVVDLVRIIKLNQYQLVHTHTARSAFIGRMAARISGVPHVHHFHSPTSVDTTHWLTNRLNMVIEKRSLRHADAVIAVSHSLGDYVLKHKLGGGLLRVVPNGVPIYGVLSKREPPVGVWTIGTIALFRPRKGLEVLLMAIAELRKQGFMVRLRGVGSFETPQYEQQIKALAAELDLTAEIDWVGFKSDIPAEFAKMDLFVLPSLFGEGLPMVVLEAMACGVPIVSTCVEGIPEAIRDTVDGLIAKAGDPHELAHQISQVVTGRVDWNSLREHAHTRQAEFFSDRHMAAAVADVYQKVLNTTPLEEISITSLPKIELLGIRINNVTMYEAISVLMSELEVTSFHKGQAIQVAFVNADCMNIARRDTEYAEALSQSDLVFADGIGVKIAGKVLQQPVKDNVNGTDLFPQLCMAMNNMEKSIYLLGGRPGVAEAVGCWISIHFPRVKIAGSRDGYFSVEQESQIIQEIATTNADVLLVALGAPKQDIWLRQHLAATGCRVGIGVGGLFDFYSGRIPRASWWMRLYGIEWFYRMCQEPRRLVKRYIIGNPVFLWRVLCQKLCNVIKGI